MINAGLYIMYTLLVIAVVASIGLPLVSALKSPGSFMKSIYGVIGIVVLFAISYAVASSDVTTVQAAKGVTPTSSKLIGAGLITFYAVSAVAVVGLIFSEINKALK